MQAAEASKGWEFVTIETPDLWVGARQVRAFGVHQMLLIASHLGFAVGILFGRKNRHIIVREFVTIPLLLVIPLWWGMRRRLYFINNHNYQFATSRWTHRVGMRILIGAGTQIASVELSMRRAIGMSSLRNDFVIPFPIAHRPLRAKVLSARRQSTVGILTSFRAEQRSEELVEALQGARTDGGAAWRLVVASRMHEPLARMRGKADELLPLKLDNSEYWPTLERFDIAIFYYDRAAYENRTSGIIADAIACGVPVICPNFPVLFRQVSWPVRMGLCYERLDELAGLIESILAWPAEEIAAGSLRHQECRGVQSYRKILSRLKAGAGGDLCIAQ
jgi:hypothetical protein